jgi:hypothetical protein
MTIRSILSFILLMATAEMGQAQWTSAHANAGNTGFVKVDTIAAAPISFADVGHVTEGANPVIDAAGTLYIGNTAGELIALHPDGTPFWKRQLYDFQGGIHASPVIGADGSIYVVSQNIIQDSKGIRHFYSYLHKFTPGGGWTGWVNFPLVNATLPDWVNGGATTAPPNIWRYNGVEVIMVPVWYQVFGIVELRLIAFSTNLGVLAVKPVTTLNNGPVTGTADFECSDFLPFCLQDPHLGQFWPSPGVALWENPGGSPWIWVADDHRATVAYKFDLATGFFEVFRSVDNHDRLSSPPVALDNAVAAVGTDDGRLKFERTGLYMPGIGEITAAPTRLFDGRLVVIDNDGLMSVISGVGPEISRTSTRVTLQTRLNGRSIASAAASCTHLFVASENEFVAYDVSTMLPVVRISWTYGGGYAPVIGPSGYVYGMTTLGLFVFPPPPPTPSTAVGVLKTPCGSVVSSGGRSL